MVVFIYTNEEQEKQIKRLPYIYKFLTYPGDSAPAIIPNEQIEQLKFMLNNADSDVVMNDNIYKLGEKVKISRGPLKGLEGELCYINPNKPMVAIRIECLGYACVNVSKSNIEK